MTLLLYTSLSCGGGTIQTSCIVKTIQNGRNRICRHNAVRDRRARPGTTGLTQGRVLLNENLTTPSSSWGIKQCDTVRRLPFQQPFHGAGKLESEFVVLGRHRLA